MRIQFLGDTFIHSDIHDLTIAPIGVIFKEHIVEVEVEIVEGALFKDSNKWYKSRNGEFYFWSGRVKIVDTVGVINPPSIPKDTSLIFDATKMNWAIKDLNILEKFWKEWGLTGKGVKVAVLDSGIDSANPDLKSAIKGSKNFTTGEAETAIKDTFGHGTRCAGLIGGRGLKKVFGIAPKCDLYIAKIGTITKAPTLESFSAALDWAKTMNVDIISMSVTLWKNAFGGSAVKKNQFQKKIDNLHKAGILLVAATGNDNLSPDVKQYPAYFSNCLSIGAVKRDGTIHQMSGKSKQLNLVAPGDNLLTTDLHNEVVQFDQTSAATAICSGILALLKQYINESDNPTLSVTELINILKETASYDGFDKCTNEQFGCGTINPVAAKEGIDQMVIV